MKQKPSASLSPKSESSLQEIARKAEADLWHHPQSDHHEQNFNIILSALQSVAQPLKEKIAVLQKQLDRNPQQRVK